MFGYCCLLINTIIGGIFAGFSDHLAAENGSGAYAASVIGVLILIAVIALAYAYRDRLSKLFDHKNGGRLGVLFRTVAAAYLICLAAYYFIAVTQKFKEFPYENTGMWAIFVMIGAVVLSLSVGRSEKLLRICGIFVPIVILGLLMIALSSLRNADIYSAMPIWGSGFLTTVGSGIKSTISFGGILSAAVLFFDSDKKPSRRAFILSTVAGIVVYLLVMFGVFSMNEYLTMPSGIDTSRLSGIGRFASRLDGVYLIIMTLSVTMYLSAIIRAVVLLLKPLRIFRRKNIFGAAVAVALSAIMLCGCGDMRDAEDTAYALAVGVDKNESGELVFTYRFPKPSDPSGDGEESGSSMTVTASSAYGGLEKIKNSIGKEPVLSHIKLVVFGEGTLDIAGDIVAELLEMREVRPSASVAFSANAEEYLSAAEPQLDRSVSVYYGLLFDERSTAETLHTNLKSFAAAGGIKSGCKYLPNIASDGFGGAVLVGRNGGTYTLTGEECALLNLMLGKVLEYREYDGVMLRSTSKAKIECTISGGIVYANITPHIKQKDKADGDLKTEIEAAVSLVSELNSNGFDILGIRRALSQNFATTAQYEAFINSDPQIVIL